MEILVNWIISAVAIFATSYLLPGVHLENFVTALVVAIVLGIINAFIKPVILILTLPITLLTLGLFTLVINALLVMLVGEVVPGFKIDGFVWALIFSILLSIINVFLNTLKSK